MTVRAVRAAAIAAALLGLLAIVALASGRDRPATGTTTDPAGIAAVRDIVLTLALTLYALAIAVIIWAAKKFGIRGDVGPGGAFRLRGFIAFLMFVGVLWVGLHIAGKPVQEFFEDWGLWDPDQEYEPNGAAGQESDGSPPPAEFRWEVVGIVLGLAAAGVALIVVRTRRPLAPAPGLTLRDRAAGDLAAVIEGTLDDLRRERDPRRAVIAAYDQLEKTLARHRFPRAPSEAPFEYLARILGELRVRAASVFALTELFERARFSRHTIDETMKDEAIEALAAVRDDLRAAA